MRFPRRFNKKERKFFRGIETVDELLRKHALKKGENNGCKAEQRCEPTR